MLGKQDVAVILKMKVKQEEPKPLQDTIRHVATAFAAKVAAALAVAGLANDGNGGCRGAMGKRGSRWSVCKESQAVSFCGITHLVRDTFIFGHRSAKRSQDGQRSLGKIPEVASFGNAFVRGLVRAIRFGQTNCYRRHGALPQDLDHEVECFFGDLRLCFGVLRPNVGVS